MNGHGRACLPPTYLVPSISRALGRTANSTAKVYTCTCRRLHPDRTLLLFLHSDPTCEHGTLGVQMLLLVTVAACVQMFTPCTLCLATCTTTGCMFYLSRLAHAFLRFPYLRACHDIPQTRVRFGSSSGVVWGPKVAIEYSSGLPEIQPAEFM